MGKEKNETIKILKNFLKKAKKITQIDRMVLFGSRARGEEKEESDIDVIIISESFKNKKSYKRSSEFYYLWDLPQEIDIICLTSEEFEKKRQQVGIIKTAYKEGIEIR